MLHSIGLLVWLSVSFPVPEKAVWLRQILRLLVCGRVEGKTQLTAALHSLVMGRAAPLSWRTPMGPSVWPGQILSPCGCSMREVKINEVLISPSFPHVLHFCGWVRLVILPQMLTLFLSFYPKLVQTPVGKPALRSPHGLLGRMNPKGCVYPAWGKCPNLGLKM